MKTRRVVPIAVIVLGVVAVVVWQWVSRETSDQPSPASSTLAPGVVTPQEVEATATPQSDGTLRVEQTLVFEATEHTDDQIILTSSYRRFGWVSDDRPAQYWFTPRIEDVSATDETSGSQVELEVVKEDRDHDIEAHLVADGHEWSPGRHLLRMTYTVSDVWFDIQGDRVLVLPLDFFHSTQRGPLDSTMVRIPDQQLICPPDNMTWDPQADCVGAAGDRWSVYEDQRDRAVQVIAVVEPDGITAEPAPAPTRKRGG